MGMSVNFTGTRQNQTAATNKKSTKIATYIGAGLGAGLVVRNTIVKRSTIKSIRDGMVKQGLSLPKANLSSAIGIASALVIFAGVGALVGKGVGKIINHFRKSDSKTTEKPDKEPPTIKVKGEGEFKVVDGNPRKVYKKDPDSGEWKFQTEVYDGSWGKPCSDEDLVNNLTKKVY